MSLNCKPGDLAVIVRSVLGKSVGRIVFIKRLSMVVGLRRPDGTIKPGPVWEVDQEIKGWSGEKHHFVCDSDLRPIRPHGDDEADESKAWLPPVPRTVIPTRHKDRSRV